MAKRTRLKRAEIEEIFARFAKASPEPLGELDFTTTFTLLVAVVLSAQTTDKSVNQVTRQLFAVADSPEKMAALGEEKLMEYTKPLGFFRAKARNVIALSQALIERHGGEVPRSREALEALPGVGRKSANVILNTAFGEPVIAVDTHVFRVSNRTGLAPGSLPRRSKRPSTGWFRNPTGECPPLADPARALRVQARVPECPRCPINDICRYPAKAV
jgi:endonuclease III